MRIAIVLDEEESRAHHARQALVPELRDPDPEQRALADAIGCGLRYVYGSGCPWPWPANDLEREDGEPVIDLFETLPGPAREPPRVRYLYTLIGEGM